MIFSKRLLLASLLLACVTTTSKTYAISENGARLGGISGGVIVGALASGLTYMADTNVSDNILIPVGLAVAGASSWVFHKMLLRLTPKNRIKEARKVLDGVLGVVEANSLLSRDFGTINLDAFQLSIVHTQLDMQINKCQKALRLVSFARQECTKNDMIAECESLDAMIFELMQALHSNLNLIIYRENYNCLCARIQKLNYDLGKIEADPCVSLDFSTAEDLINYINLNFDKRYPLVLAYAYIMSLASSIRSIVSSSQEIEIHPGALLERDWQSVATMCKELQVKMQLLINSLVNKANLISDHEDYKPQVWLSESEKIDEQQRRHAEDLAWQRRVLTEKLAKKQAEHQEDLARQQRKLTEKLARKQAEHEEAVVKQQKKLATTLAKMYVC